MCVCVRIAENVSNNNDASGLSRRGGIEWIEEGEEEVKRGYGERLVEWGLLSIVICYGVITVGFSSWISLLINSQFE